MNIEITMNAIGAVEEFRTIENFPDYAVSNCGRVLSSRCSKPRILKQTVTNKTGHQKVTLYEPDSTEPRPMFVHSLVAEAFISERPQGLVCRHLDGNPSHNVPQNLAWGTSSENMLDRHKHGTIKTKLNADKVKVLRDADPECLKDLAEKYGITIDYVYSVRSRRTWRHLN